MAGKQAGCPCGAVIQVPAASTNPFAADPDTPAASTNPFAADPGTPAASNYGGSTNPYQSPGSPQSPASHMDARAQAGVQGLWRDGTKLVMHKNAQLPDRCVKSNEPTTARLKRKLQWHHPAIYLTICAGLLIFVIIALILTKRATIYIGLSEQWLARRRTRIWIAWGIFLVSVLVFAAGIVGIDSGFGALILLGVVLFLTAAVYGAMGARMVYASRMTDEYLWINGVHPDFLAPLPEWQG